MVGRRDERLPEAVEVHRQVGGLLVDLEEVEQDADRKLRRSAPAVAELEPGAGVGIAPREWSLSAAEQVGELPIDAPLVILRRPIAGG